MGDKVRLDRFLSEESELTRSEIKKKIKSGLVAVNGDSHVRPEQKIDPEKDGVSLSGRIVRPTGMVYLMLNKPQGVLSATEDRRARTVLDLIDRPYARKLFPVGRLDKDTEGLLILTNDGMFAHNLLSPGKHVYKVYFAVVDGEVSREDEIAFEQGIDIGEKELTLPAVMRRLSVDGDFLWQMEHGEGSGEDARQIKNADGRGKPAPESSLPAELPKQMKEFCASCLTLADYSRADTGSSLCAVAIRQGKFHQIKRMFEAGGKKVTYLKRIAMGTVGLDAGLPSGKFRTLTEEEIKSLTR